MNSNFPSGISDAEWNRIYEDEEEFDPSCDDGDYCRGDEVFED